MKNIRFRFSSIVAGAPIISSDDSRATVRVMRTDEEWIIAHTVCRVLGLTIGKANEYESKSGQGSEQTIVARPVAQNGRLLTRRELSLGRPDLSL
jgi:hypothetical protein